MDFPSIFRTIYYYGLQFSFFFFAILNQDYHFDSLVLFFLNYCALKICFASIIV